MRHVSFAVLAAFAITITACNPLDYLSSKDKKASKQAPTPNKKVKAPSKLELLKAGNERIRLENERFRLENKRQPLPVPKGTKPGTSTPVTPAVMHGRRGRSNVRQIHYPAPGGPGGQVTLNVPKGWEAYPKRLEKCSEALTEKVRIICRLKETSRFYDVCANPRPLRSRPIFIGGRRLLGDDDDHEDFTPPDEDFFGLVSRASTNDNYKCWKVKKKRRYRSYAYYGGSRKRSGGSKASKGNGGSGRAATRTWVRKNFATKGALRKETKERKKADKGLRDMFAKHVKKSDVRLSKLEV
ncbi:hypothetical protein ACFL10_01050, partial [Patescibacteria group bacterium]